MRVRVGVIYGGRSSEHEVSLASAAAVIGHLDPDRYEPVPIYIGKDGRWSLARKPPTTLSAADVIARQKAQAAPEATGPEVHVLAHPAEAPILTVRQEGEPVDGAVRAVMGELDLDVIFPVVHGPYGEDGTLQGLLELAGMAYVGPGVLASAVAMDKALAKTVFEACGLPIVDYALVTTAQWEADRDDTIDALTRQLPFPLFVKPANLGSSVGVSKVRDATELSIAVDVAAEYDRRILVEVAVPEARELECAVLGNETPEASVIGEIVAAGEFYDYESKYVDAGSTLEIPATLSSTQAETLRSMALEAFRSIDCAGMARVDFLMARGSGEIYINELNTIPGFTTISMYAKLWEASGLAYGALLDRLITLALDRHRAQRRLRT